jgi:hypothetical protein
VTPKKKELAAQLRELEETVQRLATHAAVLAVAVRDPRAVPAADLDAAVAGINAIGAVTERSAAPRSEGLTRDAARTSL